MKQRSTVRLVVGSDTLVLVVGVLAIGTLQTGCTSRSVPSPGSAPQPAQTIRQARTPPNTSAGPRLLCPVLGSSTASATLPVKGGHRVILSWKASTPADAKHAAAEGYCVYRSLKRKDPAPELVNSIPFPGTSCVDDVVENGKKYYYAVRAISAKEVSSSNSNEAPAAIPTGKPSNPSVTGASVPLCREPNGVK